MYFVGWGLIAAGLFAALCGFYFDTTVPSHAPGLLGPDRVHNTGLLNDQLEVMLGAAVLFVSGVIVLCAEYLRQAISPTSSASQPSPRATPRLEPL